MSVREITFVKDQGVLAEALCISAKAVKRCEELVERAVKENRSLRWIIETANETIDLSDAEWATFL